MDKEEKVEHVRGKYIVIVAIIGLFGTLATIYKDVFLPIKEKNEIQQATPKESEKNKPHISSYPPEHKDILKPEEKTQPSNIVKVKNPSKTVDKPPIAESVKKNEAIAEPKVEYNVTPTEESDKLVNKKYFCVYSNINPDADVQLYDAPVDNSVPKLALSPGTRVVKIRESNGWFKIEVPNGRTGWINHNKLVLCQ